MSWQEDLIDLIRQPPSEDIRGTIVKVMNSRTDDRSTALTCGSLAEIGVETWRCPAPAVFQFHGGTQKRRRKRLFANGGDPITFMRWLVGWGRRALRVGVEEGRDYVARSDIVVSGGLADIMGQTPAEYWKKPYVHAFLQPLIASREYPSALHAGWPFPLLAEPPRTAIRPSDLLAWHEIPGPIGAPNARYAFRTVVDALRRRHEARRRLSHGLQPELVPPSRDWPANVHVTGYWFLDAPPLWKPPEALVQFLESGSPPVYFGFGSMGLREPKATMQIVLASIAELGRRAIVCTGWGGLGVETPLPLNVPVHAIDGAPHDWLFPRAAAAVHQGGAGTTARPCAPEFLRSSRHRSGSIHRPSSDRLKWADSGTTGVASGRTGD